MTEDQRHKHGNIVQLGFCTSKKACLAEIGEAEAAHSTIVRLTTYLASNATTTVNMTLGQLTNDMSEFRNALTGTQVFTPTTNANGIGISNVNSEGISFAPECDELAPCHGS